MNYVVITGASSGIGYEAALQFAKRGKHVVIVARREEQLKQLQTEIQTKYPAVDVQIRVADLSDQEQVYALYESVRDLHVETWVNNAGFGDRSTVREQRLTKVSSMLALNIEALTILSTLYAADYGDIEGSQLINVSSGGGYVIVGGAVTYCATKFYVSAFTEGLAQELREQGAKLQAKVLAPAATETEFAKRALELDEFQYEQGFAKYHTAKEMAIFLMELYDHTDAVVGLVDGETYEFHLQSPRYPYVKRGK
ncbi:oxidoreductase, short-chain dehydrogenase/reductase [Fictibacillus macauensis ZFHKF-1]|uniref:Oxidoreductase, short-chain dehydrogenase/reductase n=1 Tax=Fictibacillus macauensis ZFHKF-1 TaxID=1196324 RepID=I8UD53_9BACL|nr:SDR family NAD(P)-dependent oxidoreductase [Fictibacillus macauensis]EIT84855.1 oxidoreductase, short-chain dehydrogenase/reductase [Fictibacillus macauensis ZFHKF-1]